MDYYENGQIQFSGNMLNGKLDGEKKAYDESGSLRDAAKALDIKALSGQCYHEIVHSFLKDMAFFFVRILFCCQFSIRIL
jgi:hypothetical protein